MPYQCFQNEWMPIISSVQCTKGPSTHLEKHKIGPDIERCGVYQQSMCVHLFK